MTNARQLISEAVVNLRAAGFDSCQLDAEVLLAHVLGMSRGDLFLNKAIEVDQEQAADFHEFISRRAAHEPVARILGRKEFWSLDFEVSADTLVPRPDSETLVEAVVQAFRGQNVQVLDLGTGSGCLLLAILSELTQAQGLGVDISAGAIDVARRNAENLNLGDRASFCEIDYMAAQSGVPGENRADILISNPPYIASENVGELDAEVRDHDPHRALDGGPDGLAHYRHLAAVGQHFLVPQGRIYLEIGFGQGGAIADMLARAGWDNIIFYKDLAGIERCVSARRHEL